MSFYWVLLNPVIKWADRFFEQTSYQLVIAEGYASNHNHQKTIRVFQGSVLGQRLPDLYQ